MKGKVFTAQKVQSIMSGDCVMFREPIRPQPPLGCHYTINGNQSHALCFADCPTPRDERDFSKEPLVCVPPKPTSVDHRLKAPYQVGEKIFVKESFYQPFSNTYYEADNHPEVGYNKWKPAQHMKQEHSRLFLRVTGIKVERLQSISCADYFAETGRRPSITHMDLDCDTPDPRNDFKDYWNATHKKPEEKWEANPFVFCYNFEVVR